MGDEEESVVPLFSMRVMARARTAQTHVIDDGDGDVKATKFGV